MLKTRIPVSLLTMLLGVGAVRPTTSSAQVKPIRPPVELLSPQATSPTVPAPFPGRPAFKHRGFYLHCGWAFDHPFAPHAWSRADFSSMFELLRRLGFDIVMYWPQIEAIPTPISAQDAASLGIVRDVIADARTSGLRCWLVLTPNLTSPSEIATQPFADRNPFRTYQTVHLNKPGEADLFLAHRRSMLRVVNNADAYVTIDGDPGGYPDASPEDFLRIFQADRQTLDAWGIDPPHQMVIPWIWAGWGRKLPLWQGDLTPFSKAAMTLLKQRLPEPWQIIPGRSHGQGWGNGRVNVALAEQLDLIDRSMILCYEAIEFEPSPPAATLQFDAIRRILKEEMHLASKAAGVMGNAQQPIMVLPNVYLFARGAWDPAYLDRGDEEVLRDFAQLLGGPADLLLPAWQSLTLPLDRLPRDLPDRLRGTTLTGDAARCIPGGPQRYLDILAAHTTARIGLLTAINGPARDDHDCARRVADGTAALVGWWKTHHYVFDRDKKQGFAWNFVRGDQMASLSDWANRNARDRTAVASAAARLLVEKNVLAAEEAHRVVSGLIKTGP
ncbi:MAG: hypothetical protein KA354_00820 [Phycisphaerae bacterium]|nr:hypothetical protein [Phycisphaerae bacterium]